MKNKQRFAVLAIGWLLVAAMFVAFTKWQEIPQDTARIGYLIIAISLAGAVLMAVGYFKAGDK